MRDNRFKKQIEAGEKPIGIFAGMCSSFAVECIGYSGFDYVIIDNEHSPAEVETSMQMIMAAEAVGLTPFVRVREISRPAVLKLLDVGAQGLIVPNVNSMADIEQLVGYAKYRPVGNRGFCNSRKDGWGYGLCKNVPETMQYFNERVLLVPQCETAGALSCIEEIAAAEGVDGIFVGPFDLSISLGIPGEFDSPEFVAALRRIQNACRANGKFCMIFAGSAQGVKDRLAEGYDSVAYSIETSLMIECFKEKLADIRSDMQ